ncbi:translation initiation factor IF-2-like [Mustela putorius furo]|uniref:Translation initiation factor IF-2-like n=1 Tax=Mustela putorius furo TaxID=9669 RepID=A0A8U0VB70_MUSPF|nr:translation initiation factor IF-2-like [Mustela putorius furo]
MVGAGQRARVTPSSGQGARRPPSTPGRGAARRRARGPRAEAAARQAGGRGLGASGVGSEELRKERSSFRGTLEREAVRHALICICGRPPPPLLRPLRPLRLPGRGRGRGGEGRGGRRRRREGGGEGGRDAQAFVVQSPPAQPQPQPAAPLPGRTERLAPARTPPRTSSRRPPPARQPATRSLAGRLPLAAPVPFLIAPPTPVPGRPARTRQRPPAIGPVWPTWGTNDPRSLGATKRPAQVTARVTPGSGRGHGGEGSAGRGRRGPGPGRGDVRGFLFHLPAWTLSLRCEAPRGLVACPAPPSASLRDPDPGPSLRTARRAQSVGKPCHRTARLRQDGKPHGHSGRKEKEAVCSAGGSGPKEPVANGGFRFGKNPSSLACMGACDA